MIVKRNKCEKKQGGQQRDTSARRIILEQGKKVGVRGSKNVKGGTKQKEEMDMAEEIKEQRHLEIPLEAQTVRRAGC